MRLFGRNLGTLALPEIVGEGEERNMQQNQGQGYDTYIEISIVMQLARK